MLPCCLICVGCGNYRYFRDFLAQKDLETEFYESLELIRTERSWNGIHESFELIYQLRIFVFYDSKLNEFILTKIEWLRWKMKIVIKTSILKTHHQIKNSISLSDR